MRLESQKEKKINSKLNHALKQPSQSRRAFAKAGFVAPVILSLPNRSAWGANVRCTASGFGSLVEIQSGVDVADITCNYSDSNTISSKLSENAKKKKLKDLFGCDGVNGNKKIGDVYSDLSTEPWLVLIVTTLYNSEPETNTIKGGVETRDLTDLVITANNPFSCPVRDVYCHFEANDDLIPLPLGNNTEMTKSQMIYFLNIILNQ